MAPLNGATMGSLISPIMTNLFIEEFETKAINTTIYPPRLWLRYVDDTFVIQKGECGNQFLQCINSIDPHIQFTKETPNTDGSIPFLDTLVLPEPDNNLLTTVYRNLPTQTSTFTGTATITYLLSAEYSVIKTLTHRARMVCTNTQLLHKEEECIKDAILRYMFPE